MALNIKTLQEILPPKELELLISKIPAGNTSLWTYWPEFVERYLALGKSRVTVERVRDAMRLILRHTDLICIENFDNPNEVEKILLDLKEDRKMSDSSYNTYRKNINTYFIWLEKKEFIKENKIRKIERCKELSPEMTALTENQVDQIWTSACETGKTAIERARNRLFISLLMVIGARPCELLDLKNSDIDSNGRIRINGRKQKGKPRYYNLPPKAKDDLKNYLHLKNQMGRWREEKLFISLSKRSGWTEKGLRRFTRALSKKLKFRVQCYGFRRYVATTLFKQTGNINLVSKYLGHTRPQTTYRYIQDSPELNQKGMDIMSKKLAP
jgi:integrase